MVTVNTFCTESVLSNVVEVKLKTVHLKNTHLPRDRRIIAHPAVANQSECDEMSSLANSKRPKRRTRLQEILVFLKI